MSGLPPVQSATASTAIASSRVPVSVLVITLNEADHIVPCLDSVAWADDVVVVDSHSTDATVELARGRGARVEAHDWAGINAQRQYALGLARHPWVLALDADERVTPELASEIRDVVAADGRGASGYRIPRHTHYLGRWIDHGGWYPDRKLRLFRKDRARYGPPEQDPHDQVLLGGPCGDLGRDLIHLTYRNFADQLRTINRFSDVFADRGAAEGAGFCLSSLLFKPPWKFFECYVLKAGFLDGLPGLIIAASTAFYMFAKHVKRWERSRSAAGGPQTAPAPGPVGEGTR